MKTSTGNYLFFVLLCLCTAHTLFGQYKRASRVPTSFAGYVRPNSKSSLRYFSVSPERCVKVIKGTPHTYQPRRAFAVSRVVRPGLSWEKLRWNITPYETKKLQLTEALKRTIELADADNSLDALANLLYEEDSINDPVKGLTPLELAIQYSYDKNDKFQQRLIKTLIEKGADLHGVNELRLARRYNNFGALKALLPYYDEDVITAFYAKVQNELSRDLHSFEKITHIGTPAKEYEEIQFEEDRYVPISHIAHRFFESTTQKRIKSLQNIKNILEAELSNRTVFNKKECELR